MKKIEGFYTAIITPFLENGEVDYDGLRQLIRFQVAAGVDGIVALGTTGEAPTLSAKEKENIIAISREETQGKVFLMVGTGNYSTNKTIEETRIAKWLGADSVLIVTPYYNRPTQEGIYLHFKAVAEAVEIPIMVYNIQSRTGQNICTETLYRLAQIPQISSVKEASGSIAQMIEVFEQISRLRKDFTLLSGDDLLTVPSMALGGRGIISVIGNIVPLQVRELVDACNRGDFAKAREIHYKLLPIVKMAFLETNPIPVKAMMNLAGLPAGGCRLPLCDLTAQNAAFVKESFSNDAIRAIIEENVELFSVPVG